MNEMVFGIQFHATREDYSNGTIVLDDIERLINEMPFKPLGFHFAIERFTELTRSFFDT